MLGYAEPTHMTSSVQFPVLAIVGRPNVGKSALFNSIVRRRIAIVHEEAGVTRDRVSAMTQWHGKHFEVVDTGGIAFMDDEKTDDILAGATRRQAEMAIEMATALVLVVDVTAGVTPLDIEIARKVRSSGKKIFLAVNKVDNNKRTAGVDVFAELGLAEVFPIAAIHGLGVPELVEAATKDFVTVDAALSAEPPRIAIVGRPNVGKSSLINCILQSERTVVSAIPGTTRDSVDVPFTLDDKPFVLVDTAGLRHRRKINSSVDQFGLMRAERSICECNVAVLVLDALAGVTQQDKNIGGQIAEAARGCVILVNKWDLAEEQEKKSRWQVARGKKRTFREEYLDALRRELFFLDWAPVVFASAKTGANVTELFRLVSKIEIDSHLRVDTPQLNQLLVRALESYPAPYVRGKRFRIYYAFQKASHPPKFTLFCNDRSCLTPHYQRFLTDKIRSIWPFTGCPIVWDLKNRKRRAFIGTRGKTDEEEKKSR